jgi:NB-ARC domain
LFDAVGAGTTDKRTLLLLDDVWTPEDLSDLDFATPFGHGANRVLVTTRALSTFALRCDYKCHVAEVPLLDRDHARALLCHHAFGANAVRDGEVPDGEQWERHIDGVLRHCNNLPLALQVCHLHVQVCQGLLRPWGTAPSCKQTHPW